MTGVASIAAVMLALVFAWAAVGKAVRHHATVDAFGALGLPAPALLAVAVPAIEVALAVLLLARPALGASFALALLGAFTLVVIRGVLRGASAGCACFGTGREEPVGPADVVRNGLLAAFAAVATGTRSLRWPHLPSVLLMLLVAVGAVVVQAWARRRLDGGAAPRSRSTLSRTRA